MSSSRTSGSPAVKRSRSRTEHLETVATSKGISGSEGAESRDGRPSSGGAPTSPRTWSVPPASRSSATLVSANRAVRKKGGLSSSNPNTHSARPTRRSGRPSAAAAVSSTRSVTRDASGPSRSMVTRARPAKSSSCPLAATPGRKAAPSPRSSPETWTSAVIDCVDAWRSSSPATASRRSEAPEPRTNARPGRPASVPTSCATAERSISWRRFPSSSVTWTFSSVILSMRKPGRSEGGVSGFLRRAATIASTQSSSPFRRRPAA